MIGCSKKKRESYPGKRFERKKKKPRLKFNPGLALIGLRTTGPRATEKARARITTEFRMFVWWNNDSKEEEKGNWDSKRL